MSKYRVNIGSDIIPCPEDIEISAAMILAEYFQKDVSLIKRNPIVKTADFLINKTAWEHKAPRGNGKRTIQNNLRSADNQSKNIVLDLRRCKLHPQKALNNIRSELIKANNISRLVVITKSKKVLEINNK